MEKLLASLASERDIEFSDYDKYEPIKRIYYGDGNFDSSYNLKRSYDKTHNIYINDEIYTVHDHILAKCHYFKKLLSGEFNDKEIRLEVDDTLNFTIVLDVLYNGEYLQWFKNCTCAEYIQMILMLEFLQYDQTDSLLPHIKNNVRMNDPYEDTKNIAESDISHNHKIDLLNHYMDRNRVSLEFVEHRGERPISKREQSNVGPPVIMVHIVDKKIQTDNIIKFLAQYNIQVNDYAFLREDEKVTDKHSWFRSLNYRIKLYIDNKLIHENLVCCYDVIDIRKPVIDYAINKLLNT